MSRGKKFLVAGASLPVGIGIYMLAGFIGLFVFFAVLTLVAWVKMRLGRRGQTASDEPDGRDRR